MAKRFITLKTTKSYFTLVERLERILRRQLVTDKYDSVHNFLSFHKAFVESRDEPLYDVYKRYRPSIRPHQYTCVGLSLELMRRWRCVEADYPGLMESTALISCEESIEQSTSYVTCASAPYLLRGVEKEHVIVGVKVSIKGRRAMLLADPGYHVARVITVMRDGGWPSTGWFKQLHEPEVRRVYFYGYNRYNDNYVEWHMQQLRGEEVCKTKTGLAYNERPFYEAIDVTERRNIIYNTRCLVTRDQYGSLLAGIYFRFAFKYEETTFTAFYYEGGTKNKENLAFSIFKNPETLSKHIVMFLTNLSRHLSYTYDELLDIICDLGKAMADESFVNQTHEIENELIRLAKMQQQHQESAVPPLSRPSSQSSFSSEATNSATTDSDHSSFGFDNGSGQEENPFERPVNEYLNLSDQDINNNQ